MVASHRLQKLHWIGQNHDLVARCAAHGSGWTSNASNDLQEACGIAGHYSVQRGVDSAIHTARDELISLSFDPPTLWSRRSTLTLVSSGHARAARSLEFLGSTGTWKHNAGPVQAEGDGKNGRIA